jgi:hypothetical protein
MHWLQPKINHEVIDSFSARVGASTRYVLTQGPPEILVVIICQDGRKNNAPGGFCTYKFEYSPKSMPEFNLPLGSPNMRQLPKLRKTFFRTLSKKPRKRIYLWPSWKLTFASPISVPSLRTSYRAAVSSNNRADPAWPDISTT